MIDEPSPYRLTYVSPVTGAARVLPFVIGVVGDFSGRDVGRNPPRPRFVDIDRDNFDGVLSAMAPALAPGWTGEAPAPPEPDGAAAAGGARDALERRWRDLHHLVTHAATGPLLRIRVMDYGRDRMLRESRRTTEFEDWSVFDVVHRALFTPDGEPFGLLVVDGTFDGRPDHVEMLRTWGAVGATCFAPVLIAADPAAADTGRDAGPDAPSPGSYRSVSWQSLRPSEDARFLIAAAYPAGAAHKDTAPADVARGWRPLASFAVAARIAAAFTRDEWPANLAADTADAAARAAQAPAIPSRPPGPTDGDAARSDLLARYAALGLMAVVPRDDGGVDLPDPHPLARDHHFPVDEGNRQERLRNSVPAMLASCRVAHYLAMQVPPAADLDSASQRADLEKRLRAWLTRIVKPWSTLPTAGAAPACDGSCTVHPVPGAPGALIVFRIQPCWANRPSMDSGNRHVIRLPQPGRDRGS